MSRCSHDLITSWRRCHDTRHPEGGSLKVSLDLTLSYQFELSTYVFGDKWWFNNSHLECNKGEFREILKLRSFLYEYMIIIISVYQIKFQRNFLLPDLHIFYCKVMCAWHKSYYAVLFLIESSALLFYTSNRILKSISIWNADGFHAHTNTNTCRHTPIPSHHLGTWKTIQTLMKPHKHRHKKGLFIGHFIASRNT